MVTSEPNLRLMIDAIPALAWCCLPDGSTEFLNRQWLDYTGLSLEEAVGCGWQRPVHPQDLGRLMDTWRRHLESGEPGEAEARLRRFDGQYRWFLFRAEPVRDEHGTVVRWYGTNTDIEELKSVEEKLRRKERELRRIIDAIPQLIVVSGPAGTGVCENRATLEYTGLSLEDVEADDFRVRVIHPEDEERVRVTCEASLARGEPLQLGSNDGLTTAETPPR